MDAWADYLGILSYFIKNLNSKCMNKFTFWKYLKMNHIWHLIVMHLVILGFLLYGTFSFGFQPLEWQWCGGTLFVIDLVWIGGSWINYKDLIK